MDRVFKIVHKGKELRNKGFLKNGISTCAQKNRKFSTDYPQNVENLRKLKTRWIMWIKNNGKSVDNVNDGLQRRAEEVCHARHYEVSLADDARLAARTLGRS